MGKGRDKRKKREDPEKASKRAAKQQQKLLKGSKAAGETDAPTGLNNEEALEITLSKIGKQQKKIKTTEEQADVAMPSARVNVILLPHPQRPNELIIFGGEYWNGEVTQVFNDTYFYHTKKKTWSKLITPVNPMPRSSSQGIVYKHFVILFGGEYVSQSQSQFHHFKDVWRYDSIRSEWEELKNLKGGPSPRSGHRMVLWKRNAVMFGGFYDNALECRYFDDLWVLSHLEDVGHWKQITFPTHAQKPCPRSGHNMAIHENSLFVYGGFSTEKFNRFKKSEATVHHDLWMINLAPLQDGQNNASNSTQLMWTKVKLGGIPPPIRSGVASVFKDKKMYLFGGVVDIASPGGKLLSTFNNDLFVFHMDTQRFYPIVPRKVQKAAKVSKKEGVAQNLEAELAELNLKVPGGKNEGSDFESSDTDSDSSGDENENVENEAGAATTKEYKESYEVRKGLLYPLRRMDAAMTISANYLYIYGGQFESGLKEITMSDMFRMNIGRSDEYEVMFSQDLAKTEWIGKDDESDAENSWESGSTVVSAAFDLDYDDDDDDFEENENGQDENADDEDENEDEDDEGESPYVKFGRLRAAVELGPEDDGDEAPQAIPVDVTPSKAEVTDALVRVKGKKGLKAHKEQLLAQLNESALVPTPNLEQDFASFWEASKNFWISMAEESQEEVIKAKKLEKYAKCFAEQKFTETKELLEQIRVVEEQEREEARFFKERQERIDKEWDAYEKEQANDEEVKKEEEQEAE